MTSEVVALALVTVLRRCGAWAFRAVYALSILAASAFGAFVFRATLAAYYVPSLLADAIATAAILVIAAVLWAVREYRT